jgi:hypothetical protein
MNEQLHGKDGVGGARALGAAVADILNARGVYRFAGFGPREIYRERYQGLLRQADRHVEQIHVPHLRGDVLLPVDADLRARSIELLERKWDDIAPNTIMTAGKNDLLDKYLAGSSYTAAWYMGLIASGSYSAISAADTMSSHAGWLEGGAGTAPTYSQSTRPAPSWASASSGSKASNANIVFSMTGTGTAKGAFLTSVSTKDGTTGILFSAALFSQGDRAVVNGDTVNGSYSLAV